MAKRGNENSQLTKEEYDALVNNDGSPGTEAAYGGFARAPPEELAKRRIIRRSNISEGSLPVSTSNGGGSGVFSNFTFAAAAAPPSASRKPNFAMPSLPETKPNPFASISLAAPSTDRGNTVPMKESQKLFLGFTEWSQDMDIRSVHQLAFERYLTTMIARKMEEADSGSTTSHSKSTIIAPSSNETTAKSLFPPTPPAPAGFSFGSSPASAPASGQIFSFASNNNSAPKNDPPPVPTSGFSFVPAATSVAPTPGSNVKIAISAVPAPGDDDDDDAGESQPEEEKTELESADGDWNEVMIVKVRAYHYRHDGNAKKFAYGALKIQTSKENPKSHRMVIRDGTGNVLMNVGIYQGMAITKTDAKVRPGANPSANIMFMGVHDKNRGPEKFTVVATIEDAKKLHEKLVQFSS